MCVYNMCSQVLAHMCVHICVCIYTLLPWHPHMFYELKYLYLLIIKQNSKSILIISLSISISDKSDFSRKRIIFFKIITDSIHWLIWNLSCSGWFLNIVLWTRECQEPPLKNKKLKNNNSSNNNNNFHICDTCNSKSPNMYVMSLVL